MAMLVAGCGGRFRGPRTLAGAGGVAVVAGSVAWAAGEGFRSEGDTSAPLVSAGFAAVVVGLAAIVAAGGWMAATVACDHDPDCHEEEECREVPAPAGFVPYKQCMPRVP